MAHPRTDLSAREARQLAIRAQLLWERPAESPVPQLVRQLGAVQLDTISVLARSQQLVVNARLGALPSGQISAGFWPSTGPAAHFEYWSHAACLLPLSDWPLFEFRRQAFRDRGQRWHEVPKRRLGQILRQIATDGPVTTGDVGGGRKAAGWWNWSDSKIALEWLLDIGELACVRRVGFRRQYDLTERAVPAELRAAVDPVAGLAKLLELSLQSLGVGTRDDILDVHRLQRPTKSQPQLQAAWRQFIAASDVVPVQVAGWSEPAWASSSALSRLDRSRGKRNVLLSPFDSLIWYRPRMQRLFGMHHRIEAYTPAAKRVYGYFAMPVLAGDRLVARVDPNKTKDALQVRRVTFESAPPTAADVRAVAQAVREAATWIGVERIEIGECVPRGAKAPLRQALIATGVK